VLGRALRLLSLALCAIVVLSFGLFASDQAGTGSRDARAGEGDPTLVATTATAPAAAAGEHGARARVDDAARRLREPFAWAVPAGSGAWPTLLVPTALAVLVYGFGLGFLARFTNGRAT
jgi:hypothetical protein